MVHVKYTYKDGKRYGPYYYKTERVNGKIITTYLGHSVDDTRKRTFLLPLILGAILLVGIVVALLIGYQSSLTGNVALDTAGTYLPGESLHGFLTVTFQEGELVPATSFVTARLGSVEKSFSLHELLSASDVESFEGTFYAVDGSLTGSGTGYGLPGTQTTFPEITFELELVQTGSDASSNDAESTGGSDDQEPEVQPSDDSSSEGGSGQDSDPSEEEVSGEGDEEQELPSGDSSGESEDQDQPFEGSQEQDSSGEQGTDSSGSSDSDSDEESSGDDGSSDSGSSDSGGITGGVISGFAGEGERITGSASRETPFEYDAPEGYEARLVPGSVQAEAGEVVSDDFVLVEQEGSDVRVLSSYEETISGFGPDYQGDQVYSLQIPLPLFDIIVQNETHLQVDLTFGDRVLFQEESDIELGEAISEENITLVEPLNQTLENATLVNETLAFVGEIPTVRLDENGSAVFDVSSYFVGALSYDLDLTDVPFSIEGSVVSIDAGSSFKGARMAHVIAEAKGEQAISNEFTIVAATTDFSLTTTRTKIVLGQPVRWTTDVAVADGSSVVLQLPAEAENITVTALDAAAGIVSVENVSFAPSLTGQVTARVGSQPSFGRWFAGLFGSTGRVTGEVLPDASSDSVVEDSSSVDSTGDLDNASLQEVTPFDVGVVPASEGGLVDISLQEVVLDAAATHYVVDYYTAPPAAVEIPNGRGKTITLEASESLAYTDVIVVANLSNDLRIADPSRIQLYWATPDTSLTQGDLKLQGEVPEESIVEEESYLLEAIEESVLPEQGLFDNSSVPSEDSSSENASQSVEGDSLITGNAIEEGQESDSEGTIVESEDEWREVISSSNSSNPLNLVRGRATIPFEASDSDGDGFIDAIAWVVPHFSNQTYEIIVITKADHLNESREFVSDIYDSVKSLDGNWSEPIPDLHYVRVTFERNLSSRNDITIYPRIIDGNPQVEVYEKDQNVSIASFDNISEEVYQSIYLSNFSESHTQDVFDLRVIGGTLAFDHIIDPTLVINGNISDIALVALNNETVAVVYANESNVGAVMFRVFNITGKTFSDAVIVDYQSRANSTANRSRVGAAPVNETMFWIGFTNTTMLDDARVAYSPTGQIVVAKAIGDGAIGSRSHDIKLTAMGRDRFAYCYIDQVEDDVDIRMYNSTSGAAIGAESDHNAAVAANEDSTNKLDCVAMNSSLGLVLDYDGGTEDDATFHFFRDNSTEVVADTDIDTSVGDNGQVTVASMDRNRTAMFWFNSTYMLRMAIRGVDNSAILAATDLFPLQTPLDSFTDVRLSAATVKNLSSQQDNVVIVFKNMTAATRGAIMAAAYNGSGTQVTAPFTIDSNPAGLTTFAALGEHDSAELGICPGTFVVAYENNTGSLLVKSYWLNGTEWNGACNRDIVAPNVSFADPTPGNATSYLGSALPVNVTTTDGDLHYTFLDINRDVEFWHTFDHTNLDKGVVNTTDRSVWSRNATFFTSGGIVQNFTTFKWGAGLTINGSSGAYLNLPEGNYANITGKNFSLSFWMNAFELDSFGGVYATANCQPPYFALAMHSGSPKQFSIAVSNATTSLQAVASTELVPAQWYHIVVAGWDNVTNTNATLYVDGVANLSTQLGVIGGKYNNSVPNIGRYQCWGSFNGTLDDMILFSRTLSAAEVRALYNSTQYPYYYNRTGLSADQYNITAYAADASGNSNYTETRIINLTASPVDPFTLTACGDLTASGVYTLGATISPTSGNTCLNVTTQNVTIIGAGYSINSSAFNNSAIFSNQINTTLIGLNISTSNRSTALILMRANNSLISNVTITRAPVALSISDLSNITVRDVATRDHVDETEALARGFEVSNVRDSLFAGLNTYNVRGGMGGTGSEARGFSGTNLNGVSLVNSTFSTTASTADFDGIGVFITLSTNLTLVNVSVINSTATGSLGYGIWFASVNSSVISSSFVSDNMYNIYLQEGHHLTIANSTLNATGFISLSVGGGAGGINLRNFSLVNVTFSNSTTLTRDLVVGLGLHEIFLVDIGHIQNYTFTNPGSNLTFRSTNLGEVAFTTPINGSGGNLTADVRILNNSVFVNSSQMGLNKSANVTLYGIPVNFVNPTILLDGSPCNAPMCNNFTSFIAGTILFNVSSWSNYSIGPTDSVLPYVNFTTPTLANGSSVSGDSIYVNVTSSDNSGNHFVLTDFNHDLLFWMRMDDINASGDPLDSSWHKSNGSAKNGAVQNVTGAYGKSFSFDGTNDNIIVGDVASLRFTNDSNFSISAWTYRKTNNTVAQSIFDKFASGGYRLYYNINGLLIFQMRNETNSIFTVGGGARTAVPNNVWAHTVVTFTGTNISLYINGTNVASEVPTLRLTNNTLAAYIGYTPNNIVYFNGSIDEVMVFNRTLTPTEVNALYNATRTSYARNFTTLGAGQYNFTSYAVDSSGNVNSTENRTVILSAGDTTAPGVTLNAPEARGYVYSERPVFVNVTLSETGQTVLYSLTGGLVNYTMSSTDGLNYNATNTSIVSSSYTIYIYANDTSGNRNDTITRTFTLDMESIHTCYTLDRANVVFGMNQSIVTTNSPCINVTANNITLDGRNFNITHSSGGGSTLAINATSVNRIEIRNLSVNGFATTVDTRSISSTLHAGNITVINSSISSLDMRGYTNYSSGGQNGTGTDGGFVVLRNSTLSPGANVSLNGGNSTGQVGLPGNAGAFEIHGVFVNLSLRTINFTDGRGMGIALVTYNSFMVINFSSDFETINTRFGEGLLNHLRLANISQGQIIWGGFNDGEADLPVTIPANLSKYVSIGSNVAYLNATGASSLNQLANITLYGVSTTFVNPGILRDGVLCSSAVCRNLTSLTAGTVVFNVTSWSNYSIGPADSLLPHVNFTTPTLANGSSVIADSIYVNVTSSDNLGNHYVFSDFNHDLLFWMRMDDTNASGDPLDASSYKYNGSAKLGSVQNISGRYGTSFSFDGANDYLSVGNVPAFEFANSSFTLSFWVYTYNLSLKNIAGKIESSGNNGWNLRLSGNAVLFNTGNISSLDSITGSPIPLATWTHIVATYNLTTKAVYINGTLSSSREVANAVDNSSIPFEIGRYPNIATQFFNGSIDEVIILNRSLSAAEVASLYNATANQYYSNFSSLSAGQYNFTSYAVDSGGNVNSTENRTVTLLSTVVTSCQVLDQPNTIYSQGANIVPSGSIIACINITAENVTFNGNGYWIANSTFVRRGVHSGQRNTTILGTNISLNSTATTAIGIMFEQSGSVSFNNSRIYNNTVTDVYYGVYFSCTSPIPRYFVELNKTFLRNNSYGWYTTCARANVTDITVLNAGASAILVSGHNNSVTNFSIAHTASGGNGIQIVNARQNLFANGTMQNNSNALYVNGPSDYTENNEFSNISIVNTSGYDYRSSSSASVTFTGNTLTDMYLQNYSIGYESTMIEALIVRTSGQGAIQFLAGVNGSGTNFTNDIRVSSNFAYVNATRNTTQTGMNRSATITFYNMPGTFANPTILRDGVTCSAPNCNNLTSLNAATVIFNVSAWSNYSIGESLSVTSCQILGQANSIYTQTVNITPWDNVTTLTCINITAPNVTFNGNGYSIRNTTFYADGIYSNQINTTVINANVTVTNLANSWAGVHFVQANNSRVINSTLNAQRYGVNLESTSHTLVENITANANADTGIVLSSTSTNNTIRGNIANSNPRGISLSGTGGNIFINNNASFNSENIRVLAAANVFSGTYAANGSSRGVSIFSSGNNNIFYNTTLESNFDGIWISANSNNSFFGGLINGSLKDAIVVGAGGNPTLTTDNRFANITIVNTNSSRYDLNISTASLNKTLFTDMVIANYTFFGVGGTVIVNSSTYGYIYFTQTINGSGTNFSADILLGNNSVFVNASQAGLNKTANITLYGLSTNFFNPTILRDGTGCSAPNCNNFTSLNAGTVVFNVTGWSNYSIGSSFVVTSCTTLDQANTIYTQGGNIRPNIHPCINITATNITLIGNGYSFANSTFNYTVIYTNQTNTTLTGLNISISSTSASGTALYLNRSTNSRLSNITLDTAYTGIFFEAVNATPVNLATIRNTVDGIYVGIGSRDLNITNIDFYNSTDGIHIFGTGGAVTNIQLFNVTIRASTSNGLRVVSASRTVIQNATVIGGSTGISVDSLSSGSNLSYISLHDNSIGLSLAQTNPVLEHALINGSTRYGLRVTGASDNGRFSNLTFYNNNVSLSFLANTGSANNHNFTNVTIVNSSNSAIVFDVTGLGSLSRLNFTSLSVTGTNTSYYDAEFIASGTDLQTVAFEDSYVGNYSFAGAGGRFFFFSSSQFGLIKFAGVINGSGTNLTGFVRVTNNTASVNASNVGLNQSANITLLNLPAIPRARVIYNGIEHCPSSVCANFTSLESGGTVRFNVPGWSNYSIGNLPPVNITLTINSTSGSNKTEQDLNCYGTLLDLEADAMNVTVYWYNSSVLHYTADRNNTSANATFASFSLDNANTTKGHNWSCGFRIFDGISYRFVNTSYNLTILNTLPNVTLLSPPNANLTTDRTPVVNFSVYDADNETVTWNLNVTLNKVSLCTDPSRHYQSSVTAQTFGTNVSYEITPDLHCLYDNLDSYNWTVRANDSDGSGSWSETWKINVSSIVSITLLNNTIEFGSLGYLESNDTDDNSPRPFLLENDGTVFVNVTIVSTQLWATQSEASAYYTFKAANYTYENNSFSSAQSILSYTLLKISPQSDTMCFAYLNYTDASDTGEIDINITVPTNEPPGVRRANVTLLASLAE